MHFSCSLCIFQETVVWSGGSAQYLNYAYLAVLPHYLLSLSRIEWYVGRVLSQRLHLTSILSTSLCRISTRAASPNGSMEQDSKSEEVGIVRDSQRRQRGLVDFIAFIKSRTLLPRTSPQFRHTMSRFPSSRCSFRQQHIPSITNLDIVDLEEDVLPIHNQEKSWHILYCCQGGRMLSWRTFSILLSLELGL